jgi:dTDP-4-amino-4,6-dideoxygalactose transaminase
MPLTALRPVGSYVPLTRDTRSAVDLTCGGRYRVRFLDSGTSALAQALVYARSRQQNGDGQALFPGYGCPDLIAAAVFAGVSARLVDTEPDTPWLDLRAVERDLGNSSAVVAVNFLGMPERLDALRDLTRANHVTLIEDSAQMAPFSAGYAPSGDLVVYSFGRGKPVSLLTGGALLVRADWAEDFERVLPATPAVGGSALKYLLKRLAYNLAITPPAYALLRRMTFLKLGEVAFHALPATLPMDAGALETLGAAFAALPSKPGEAQRALQAALAPLASLVTDLPATLDRTRHPLLRYPLLLEEADRDDCVRRLENAGLGASPFYGRALARLPGVPGVDSANTPNAESFAARLVTLPVHSDVTPAHVAKMAALLSESR